MTQREWFATFAPTEIPEWYRTARVLPRVLGRDEALAMQPGYLSLPVELRNRIRNYMNDPCFDWDGQAEPGVMIAAALEVMEQSRKARDDAELAERQARYFAWRWHYADEMLKGRL